MLHQSTTMRCSQCGVEKPLREFRRRGDTYRNPCKACHRGRTAVFYAQHADEIRERERARYTENRDAILAYQRDWYEKHPGKRREYHLREDPAKLYERMKRSRARHPETMKAWRERTREHSNAWGRDYHKRRPEFARTSWKRRAARKRGATVCDFTSKQWKERLLYFNGHCAYCGQPFDSLEQEHMRPLSQGGDHTLSNIVPACRSCNARKSVLGLAEYLLKGEGHGC